jgi:hypothetical protein
MKPRKLQTKQRFSQAALLRTIKNRMVEARQQSILQTIPVLKKRAEAAVPALQGVLDAFVGVKDDLLKQQAMVTLGRMMPPGMESGGQAAILGIRQDISALTLDERDDTKTPADALLFINAIINAAAAAKNDEEVKRWEWAASVLPKLEHLDAVNVEALWRASEYAVNSSIPFDDVYQKR